MIDSHAGTRSALSIALIYAVIGCLWIFLSDKAVEAACSDPDVIIRVSMLKGWFYVGATSLLLFLLLRHYFGRMQAALQGELDAAAKRQGADDLLAAIADNSEDAIFAKDLNGRYLFCNNAVGRLVGKPAAQVLGRDDRAFFPPDQAAMLMAIGERIVATGEVETREDVLDTVLGRRTFLAVKGPLRDAEGRIFGTFSISRDITGIKQAQDALRESEQRFHDIVEATADWIWEVDAEGRYTYVSDSVFDLLGYTPAELIGKTPFDLMPAGEAERIRAEFSAIAARKARVRDLDNINLHKDGRLVHVSTNGMPILAADGTLLGYRGLDRDITAKKISEGALRDAHRRLRTVIDALPDLAWLKDTDGVYLACNARFEAFFGAREAEIVGKTDYDFVSRELADFFRAKDMAALAAAGPSSNEEEVTFASDGHRETLQTIKAPLRDSDGRLVGVLGVARDITAIKAAEAGLRARNEELERFNRATVGRELDMLEMKKTINALSRELGRAPPYPLAFLKDEGGAQEGQG